jgi:serine-type D-Ala-D-Ala carboxypeptidase/endopeptidase (penicillin-binding protein 4)
MKLLFVHTCFGAWISCFVLQPIAQTSPVSVSDGELRTLASLQSRLASHIAQPRFAAAMWGVKIVSLDTGKTLFEYQARKLLKPASVAKLYTGALALDRLGPDFRFKTSLYSTHHPDKSGTLDGDLIVYGRGDPSFAARFNEGDYDK